VEAELGSLSQTKTASGGFLAIRVVAGEKEGFLLEYVTMQERETKQAKQINIDIDINININMQHQHNHKHKLKHK
jgi:hypothetical protein